MDVPDGPLPCDAHMDAQPNPPAGRRVPTDFMSGRSLLPGTPHRMPGDAPHPLLSMPLHGSGDRRGRARHAGGRRPPHPRARAGARWQLMLRRSAKPTLVLNRKMRWAPQSKSVPVHCFDTQPNMPGEFCLPSQNEKREGAFSRVEQTVLSPPPDGDPCRGKAVASFHVFYWFGFFSHWFPDSIPIRLPARAPAVGVRRGS